MSASKAGSNDRDAIVARLLEEETRTYQAARPRSKALFERAQRSFIGGVPMQWMTEWAGGFPLFTKQARGARVTDVDGHDYVDFCLGDTGAMFGHGNPEIAEAVADQARNGITLMLPSEDAVEVAEALGRRFGLPYWQITMSATDANRFVLRLARDITDRPLIAVFDGCYHGTVDETIVSIENGKPRSRAGNVGPAVDPTGTTRVVEFNDLAGLDRALADGKVACVLTEPALTNIGIVLPDPGFHEGMRRLTRKYETLLVIDETHTLSTGPGGYTRAHGLEPDFLTMGKPLGSGIPAAAFGMSEAVARKVAERTVSGKHSVAGIGGTLTANWLAMRAMRVTLERVMTEANYKEMVRLATRLEADIQKSIDAHGLDWHVTRLGARLEYRFQPDRPRNGREARGGGNDGLNRLIHLYCLNRGVMLTPMHNMLLVSPFTTEADVARHGAVFDEFARRLTGH